MVLVSLDNFPLLALLLLVLAEGRPLEYVLLGICLCDFIEDENDISVETDNSRINVNFILQFQYSFLCNIDVFLNIEDLHLVMLLNLKLVFKFLADGGLEQKTDLGVINLHDFLDDLIGEVMDDDLFVVFPNHNVLFLKIEANQLPTSVEVKMLHF